MPASREALFQGNAHATGPVPLLVTEWHSPIVEYRTSQQHSIARHLLNSFHSIWHKDQREALLTWRIVFLVSVQPISTIEYWKYLWCLGCSSEGGYTTIMLQGLWLIAAFVLLTSCWLHKEYSVCYSLWPAKCHGFNRLWLCASAFISLSFLLMYLEGACMFQKVHHHTCFNKLFCNHVCVDIKLHGRVQFWKARRPNGTPPWILPKLENSQYPRTTQLKKNWPSQSLPPPPPLWHKFLPSFLPSLSLLLQNVFVLGGANGLEGELIDQMVWVFLGFWLMIDFGWSRGGSVAWSC